MIRSKLRKQRAGLSSNSLRQHSQQATQRLIDRLDSGKLSCLAGYLASDGEIDLSNAFKWLHLKNVAVSVPYVCGSEMRFALYERGHRLVRGKWGINVPDPITDVDVQSIDMFLTPVVAFSSKGDRLGRGGGYYDRTLCLVAQPLVVGIAHEFQLNEGIVATSTDVRLGAVVTEQRWRIFDPDVTRILEGT